ncbi:hypothetical protein MNV49_006478 [Pseudohyphozyma bogoriensis]|nr:hypothetical protein MNV49_006478 [Pseudohyphozyma bogoriensis]
MESSGSLELLDRASELERSTSASHPSSGTPIGVLQSYWSSVLFADHPSSSLLPLAASLCSGLMYTSIIFVLPLFNRYPHQRAKIQLGALFISAVGLFSSAFVTKPWHLIITLGLLYPFSATFYLPGITILFEWFQARKGLASGILYGGTGAGGCIFPFIIQALLDRFGYKTTMIALSLNYFIVGSLALINIKTRLPLPPRGSSAARQARRVNTSFVRHPAMWSFTGAILLSSCGNFIPSIWIPTYALDLSLSTKDGTLLLSLMNAASVPGCLTMGYLSDIIPVQYVIMLSCGGSAASCLLLWGFAKSLPILVVFCLTFGFLGLSFTAVWTKLVSIIALDDPLLPGVISSVFAFGRGLGNISSGPVASALLKTHTFKGAAGGYGVGNYGALLLYSGVTIFIGGVVGIMSRETPRKPESSQ